MVVGDQERDIISLLTYQDRSECCRHKGHCMRVTFTGFLRSTIKLSALCIMNRVNLWHKILSISSACLILILIRIELIEGSINTRSFSFLEIVSGLSSTSCEPLTDVSKTSKRGHNCALPDFHFRLVMSFHNLRTYECEFDSHTLAST